MKYSQKKLFISDCVFYCDQKVFKINPHNNHFRHI